MECVASFSPEDAADSDASDSSRDYLTVSVGRNLSASLSVSMMLFLKCFLTVRRQPLEAGGTAEYCPR